MVRFSTRSRASTLPRDSVEIPSTMDVFSGSILPPFRFRYRHTLAVSLPFNTRDLGHKTRTILRQLHLPCASLTACIVCLSFIRHVWLFPEAMRGDSCICSRGFTACPSIRHLPRRNNVSSLL
jgi:hypothetical protein